MFQCIHSYLHWNTFVSSLSLSPFPVKRRLYASDRCQECDEIPAGKTSRRWPSCCWPTRQTPMQQIRWGDTGSWECECERNSYRDRFRQQRHFYVCQRDGSNRRLPLGLLSKRGHLDAFIATKESLSGFSF
jgi:hypothetical protein